MKFRNMGKKFGVIVAGVGASLPAFADVVMEAQTALEAAEADGLTVGGYVVATVAALLVVGIVLRLLHKV